MYGGYIHFSESKLHNLIHQITMVFALKENKGSVIRSVISHLCVLNDVSSTLLQPRHLKRRVIFD